MPVTNNFQYDYLFNGPRPGIKELIVGVPMKYLIAILSTITDALAMRGARPETQDYLMQVLTVNVPLEDRWPLLQKANRKFYSGYELFASMYTVEFINWIIINHDDEDSNNGDYGSFELNFIKAYAAIVDEQNDRDKRVFDREIQEAEKGGKYLERLMWPHLLRQWEFTNEPDFIKESFKGMALMSYFDRHHVFGKYSKSFFSSLRCDSGNEYLNRLFSALIPSITRKVTDDPMDYLFRVRVDSPEPVLESLVIDVESVKRDVKKQIGYLGLKERPLFKFSENEYFIPYRDFFYEALFTGSLFTFYYKSGVQELFASKLNDEIVDSGFGNFKAIIGKEFSENILFKNTFTKCFARKHETLKFFDDGDAFNPDCYYRQGNSVFIIEFKDYLPKTEIIQFGTYDEIKQAINEKFVSVTVEKKGKQRTKDKGIYQLARNIELLASDSCLFWQIDEMAHNKRLKFRNMTVYPMIVQTSIHFDFPGINKYLDELLQDRLSYTREKLKGIRPLTMINFDYFFDKLTMFETGSWELKSEVENYHSVLQARRKKAERTRDTNDWFDGLRPFAFIESQAYKNNYNAHKGKVLKTIRECWQIER